MPLLAALLLPPLPPPYAPPPPLLLPVEVALALLAVPLLNGEAPAFATMPPETALGALLEPALLAAD
jgi:hypothetical protein